MSTELILRNAARIAEIAPVVIRVPTIPTINAFDEEFINISTKKTAQHLENPKAAETRKQCIKLPNLLRPFFPQNFCL